MLLMAGGVSSSPAAVDGAASAAAALIGAGEVRDIMISRTISNAAKASPAIAQGVRSPAPPDPDPDPIPRPHPGQNRAPGPIADPLWRQACAPRGAPQLEQNRPEPTAPQAAQLAVVV
jgi:hypothetical protein